MLKAGPKHLNVMPTPANTVAMAVAQNWVSLMQHSMVTAGSSVRCLPRKLATDPHCVETENC